MSENGAVNFFPKQMNITERRLSGFCTNEVGFLLDHNEWASFPPKRAIIGNPLRYIHFDDNSGNKLLNFTGSANLIDQNCTGKYLSIVAGSNLCIFDLHKGAILREFHDHDGAISNVAWHRTSPWLLASVGIDSTLRLWDLRLHPAQLQMRRTARPFTCLEYSPDCNYIACGGQLLSVFDLNMTQSVQYIPCNSPATNILFNPAECLMATSHEDQSICFWDMDTGECVTQSPSFESKVGKLCFPFDGKYLIANIGTKICSIRWEPFELISQISFPFPGHFPSRNISSSQISYELNESIPLTHLDMRVKNDVIFGLSIINKDSGKIGTACLSTISLNNFENCSTIESPILDCVKYLPSNNNSLQPPFPTSASAFEINNIYDENEIDITQLTNVTLENINTETPDINNSKLQQVLENIKSVDASPSKTCHTKRPNALEGLSGNTTSFESGGGVHSSSASARSSSYDLRSPTSINTRKFSSKINRKPNEKASTEFKINNISEKRPNRLPLIQNQQQHSNSFTCHGGQKPSFTPKQLVRRGSSLNDVTDPVNNNNDNNMPSGSIVLKNRSKSQAQKDRVSKFSTSSSSNTSNCTNSIMNMTVIGNNRQKSESSDSDDELEEFLQQDSKVRANILKRTKEIKTLLDRSNGISENTLEFLIKESGRFEDSLTFAFLLEQYMDKKNFNMLLNELFLCRVASLLVHKNKKYIQLAIGFLDMVTLQFGKAIRHGLASQEFTIGVDVEAEQRFKRCTNCKNSLFQIRLNTAFNMERMNIVQRRQFEKDIMPRIDQIVKAAEKSEKSPDVHTLNASCFSQ